MKTIQNENLGASPLPKGKRKSGSKLFTKAAKAEDKTIRDKTGQTDTTLKEMKQRMKEVPKKSAGSNHDKEVYSKN